MRLRWWRRPRESETSPVKSWRCETCGWTCWLANARDLQRNVANHLASPEHIERAAQEQ